MSAKRSRTTFENDTHKEITENDDEELKQLQDRCTRLTRELNLLQEEIQNHPARLRQVREVELQRLTEQKRIQERIQDEFIVRDNAEIAKNKRLSELAGERITRLLELDINYPWVKPDLKKFQEEVSKNISHLWYTHAQFRYGYSESHGSDQLKRCGRSVVASNTGVWDEINQCGPKGIRDYSAETYIWKWKELSRYLIRAPDTWAIVALVLINAPSDRQKEVQVEFDKRTLYPGMWPDCL